MGGCAARDWEIEMGNPRTFGSCLVIGLAAVLLLALPALAQEAFPWDRVVGAEAELEGLDEASRARVVRLAERAPSYHLCRGSVSQCLAEEPPDPIAQRLAGFLVRRVRAGDNDGEIEARLLARRLSARPREVAHLDLAEAACLGPEDAPVTVVEFADFECPFCRMSSRMLESIARDSDGQIRLCFKHFPLRSHSRSMPAAVAAWAAHRQGRFWAMHDALYASAPDFSDEAIERAAQQAGLDMERFHGDVSDGAVAEEVMADKYEGLELGIDRTPTLFVNGKRYVGDLTEPELRDRLAEELEMLR
jgi:protein-disulfide isomerase